VPGNGGGSSINGGGGSLDLSFPGSGSNGINNNVVGGSGGINIGGISNGPSGIGSSSTGGNGVSFNPSNSLGPGGGGNINLDNFGDDVNCDNTGTCYDVTVHCKDTRIVVNVGTNRPFSGRIYALGRSETCNVDVINSDSFRLDLTMSGQDCNTQSVAGVYTNTVVVQRHSVVMTKTDKIYKVRCTYDTTSRNITFGMMPIRDPDMISITSAPEAPAPRISILNPRGQEVETVRIGDKLTFRIEIPDKTPYGIFARSCVAMAKDSRSTFAIIDEEGCPIDPTIFPRFTPDGNALISQYEAFRFTESYGVIFQCNVKYCLGPCPPANCIVGRDSFESWGKRRRKRRAISAELDDTQTRLSHEIIVLDIGDETQNGGQDQQRHFDAIQPHDGNATDYRVSPFDWHSSAATVQEGVFEGTPILEGADCDASKKSVMALAVTCSMLLVLYVCTVFCMCTSKRFLKSSDGGAKLASSSSGGSTRHSSSSVDAITRNYMNSATYLR